jgi:hypothetical protein
MATVYDRQPETIPATYNDVYRPEHPDADWSGHVPKIAQKRHEQKHRSKEIHIEQGDLGLVGSSSVEPRKMTLKGQSTDREVFMGGVGSGDDQWKTSYRRFEAQEKTSKDQLTLVKRAPPRKPLPDPVYGRTQQQQQGMQHDSAHLNPYDRTSQVHTEQRDFNKPRSNSSNKSFLGSLGASLADSMPDEKTYVKNGKW